MNYQVYRPPHSLRNYIRYFWSLDINEVVPLHKLFHIFADRYPRLIFQNLEGGDFHQTKSGVYALTKKFKISERQIERKFKTFIGIAPHNYLRILRFEKTLHRLRVRDFKNLSDIAYDLNYSDHAHFTREFKELSGYTPKAFLAKTKLVEENSSFLTIKPGNFPLH